MKFSCYSFHYTRDFEKKERGRVRWGVRCCSFASNPFRFCNFCGAPGGFELPTFWFVVRFCALQGTTAADNTQRNQRKAPRVLGSRSTVLYPVHGHSHGQSQRELVRNVRCGRGSLRSLRLGATGIRYRPLGVTRQGATPQFHPSREGWCPAMRRR
jgi:hypothetical protein